MVQGAPTSSGWPLCLHRATEFWRFRWKNYLKWKTIPVETRRLFCV